MPDKRTDPLYIREDRAAHEGISHVYLSMVLDLMEERLAVERAADSLVAGPHVRLGCVPYAAPRCIVRGCSASATQLVDRRGRWWWMCDVCRESAQRPHMAYPLAPC